jgi:hypothetical protein
VDVDALCNLAARVRRAAAERPQDARTDDLRRLSPALARLLDIDAGKRDALPEGEAVSALVAGQLDAVHPESLASPVRETLTMYLGASEGASPEQVARALALPPASKDDVSGRWLLAALSARAGKTVDTGGDPVAAALAGAELAKDPFALDRVVAGMDPFQRGAARAAAVVRLGERAPPAWRHEARALLFGFERPYLRP